MKEYLKQIEQYEKVQIRRDHCGSCKATNHRECYDRIIKKGKIPVMRKCTTKQIPNDNEEIHKKCVHPRGSSSGITLSVYKYAKGFVDGAKFQQLQDLKPMAALVRKAKDREKMKIELEKYVVVLNRILHLAKEDKPHSIYDIEEMIKEIIE